MNFLLHGVLRHVQGCQLLRTPHDFTCIPTFAPTTEARFAHAVGGRCFMRIEGIHAIPEAQNGGVDGPAMLAAGMGLFMF